MEKDKYCFLNMERVCTESCVAFTTAPGSRCMLLVLPQRLVKAIGYSGSPASGTAPKV